MSPLTLLRSTGVLIAGAVALQTLLYGAVLVVRLLRPEGQEAAAGRLLAAITVTRIPIFLFQSLEALVVPRIAELALRGDVPVLVAGSGASCCSWPRSGRRPCWGPRSRPAPVSLMFGAGFTVSHTTMALLGLGTGVFMVAVALSDVTVFLGGHARMALSWVAGLVAGALSLLVIPDFDLQVTVPLVVGSVVAAALLGRAAQVRVQDLAVSRPPVSSTSSRQAIGS